MYPYVVPNSLEKTILRAAKKAQKHYGAITGGQWLDHAPEFFLQVEVARGIWKDGFRVFIDASNKRNRQQIGSRTGRVSAASRKRFDISVWRKSTNSLRAVVEIKRDWGISSIREDAGKIKNSFKQAHSAPTGYLLIYSEANRDEPRESHSKALRRKLLERRFIDWASKLRWNLVDVILGSYRTEWWGIALLRLDNKRKRT